MEEPSQRKQINKKISEVKIFPVPFSLKDFQEKITITTTNSSQLSKEKTINQAIKFHLEGNIS